VSSTTKGDLSGETASDIQSGKVSGTIQNMETVYTDWDSYDQALNLNGLDDILKQYAHQLVIAVETNLCTYMQNNGGLSYGTPGTPADSWMDVAGSGAMLQELGASGQMWLYQ